MEREVEMGGTRKSRGKGNHNQDILSKNKSVLNKRKM